MRSKSVLFAAAAMAIAGTGLMTTAGTVSATSPTGTASTASTASTSSAAPAADRALASTADAGPLANYNGACGNGYKVVNSAGIGNLGTVYLTYNSSAGKNCVVTIRNKSGSRIHMKATLQVLIPGRQTDPVIDEGNYRSYAGPVYVKAKGYCVRWGGSIRSTNYLNPGSNCGSRES